MVAPVGGLPATTSCQTQAHQLETERSVWSRAIAVALTTAGLLAQGSMFQGGTRIAVRENSPAELGGLRGGDEIVNVAGAPVSTWDDIGEHRLEGGEASWWRWLVMLVALVALLALLAQLEPGG